MECIEVLYEQFYTLVEKIQESSPEDFSINLLKYDITEDYYNKVDHAAELLKLFCDEHLMTSDIKKEVNWRFECKKTENVKFALLIDTLRCYDGLGHPTSFTSPEGIALMMFMGKLLCMGETSSYEQLQFTNAAMLSLIDIIPHINKCSEELGDEDSLFLSSILRQSSPELDCQYRILLYRLCKSIAEVDGEISISEQEWLNEIALLNDDDPDNDIDVHGI